MKKLLALVAALAFVCGSIGCDGAKKEAPIVDKPAAPGGGAMSGTVKPPEGIEGKPAGDAPAPEAKPAGDAPAPEAPP